MTILLYYIVWNGSALPFVLINASPRMRKKYQRGAVKATWDTRNILPTLL
jgi:hypothetical protein